MNDADFICCDTSVLAYLTKRSEHSAAYSHAVGGRRIALSFQVYAELLSVEYTGKRAAALQTLLAATVQLPPSDATSVWYARIMPVRKRLRTEHALGADAGDADVWILSSAMEHRVALLSHDTQQVALARAMGHFCWTNLPELKGQNPQ